MTEPTLTHREYLAVIIRSLRYPNIVQPLWLAASDSYRADVLAVADALFESWKQHELDMEQLRKEVYDS